MSNPTNLSDTGAVYPGPEIRVSRGSPCEKCWADAASRLHKLGTGTQSEHYTDLIQERDAAGTPCTPSEQRGDQCPRGHEDGYGVEDEDG